MKTRFFALILAAVLLTAPAALAVERSDFVGGWACIDSDGTGALFEVFYLGNDGTVYYLNQLFTNDAPGFGRQAVNSWRFTGDGAHIVYGNTAEGDAVIRDGYLFIDIGDGYRAYSRVEPFQEASKPKAAPTPEPAAKSAYSYTNPTTLRVGQDIPAGTYRVYTLAMGTHTFTVWGGTPFDYERGGGLLFSGVFSAGNGIDRVELHDGNVVLAIASVYVIDPIE